MIAEGRLTRVYLALHVDAPRQTAPAYAVKMVRADLTDRTAAVALLRREATVARRARHPHLVSVLAEHTSEAPYFLVMPLLEGESLDRHLVRRGVLPIGLVLWYLRQVCEALVTMHQSGFIHGDIKPANIHVSRQGHATLLDLGFARQPSGRSATGELALLGTPNYLAPELISRGGEADIRSDFFSLGVTLFELLTGQLPYDLHERGERSTESAMGTARRMRRLNPNVSRGVAELAAHLLAHDPLRRPQEPHELLRHLVALEIEHLADRV
jgi:serine/threonine protein kinase